MPFKIFFNYCTELLFSRLVCVQFIIKKNPQLNFSTNVWVFCEAWRLVSSRCVCPVAVFKLLGVSPTTADTNSGTGNSTFGWRCILYWIIGSPVLQPFYINFVYTMSRFSSDQKKFKWVLIFFFFFWIYSFCYQPVLRTAKLWDSCFIFYLRRLGCDDYWPLVMTCSSKVVINIFLQEIIIYRLVAVTILLCLKMYIKMKKKK